MGKGIIWQELEGERGRGMMKLIKNNTNIFLIKCMCLCLSVGMRMWVLCACSARIL